MKKKNLWSALLTAFLFSGFIGENFLSAEVSNVFPFGERREIKEAITNPFLVNEIQTANIDMFMDPSFNYGGWIELYNPNDTPAFLHEVYITDDITQPKKYKLVSDNGILKAKTFRVFWFGANIDTPSNVNFKLDADGGILYFFNASGELLLSQIYPPSICRTSYARKVDGGDEWGYTAMPSPNYSNRYAVFSTERVAAPVVDHDSQLFTTPFEVKVEIPAGTTLYYTTDGTTPNLRNGKVSTSGIFTVGRTSIFRFCLMADNKLPSQVITRSYIKKSFDVNLPVISIVTDKRHIYDEKIGIFVRGNNGKPGNGQSGPCNWNMDWDRPVNVEMITPEGKMVINQETALAVSGGWSRATTPHSFKVKAKKVYEGASYLPYQIFKSKPHLKNKTWQVRNGGNDARCRIKDAALQTIVHSSGIDVDGQACQPVMHFINGEFKGMLNLREPNNKDYAYANYGWDDNEIDQFQINGDSNYSQTCGTEEAFLEWYHLSAQAKEDAVYEKICRLVDIDEYVNYMAVELYYGCSDYAKNNIKGFRPRIKDGKFRIVLYDLDSAFGTTNSFGFFESMQTHTFRFDSDNDGNKTEEVKFVTIFLNMLENEKFRKKFIDTFCLVTGSIFEPERCIAIIDSMAQERVAPLALENKSPMGTANKLKSHLAGRQRLMIQSLKDYKRMHLSGVKEQHVKLSSNIKKAQLKVNDIPVPMNKFEGSLFHPVSVKASAPAGYKFVGWKAKEPMVYTTLVEYGSNWKYYDKGSLDGKAWQTQGNSTIWAEGTAPFGYNYKRPDVAARCNTKLDFGPDSKNKRITYYFYKEFNLTDAPTADDEFIFNYAVDDGAVVYINGEEVGRFMMPDGTPTYKTYTYDYIGGEPAKVKIQVPASLMKKGKNKIAVEVHNCSASSSDIYFDGELLYGKENTSAENILTENETCVLPAGMDLDLIACYDLLSEEEQAALVPPVVINEISADNSIFINDYFRKNDWIELYNRSNQPVDIAGMYLSDDHMNPHKYQIVSRMDKYETLIPAHSHLVIWADRLVPIHQIHTNFKLACEGGEVLLTANDDTWADTLIYEAHSGKYSVGRYPDGAEQLYVMTMPTFGTTNRLNSYARLFTEPEYPLGIDNVMPAADEMGVSYAQRVLTVYGTTLSPVQIHIYNICGQCVMQRRVDTEGGRATVALEGLRKGSYVARISDAQGRQCHIKFLIATDW